MPFLSYLPKRYADFYIKAMGYDGRYSEHHFLPSYSQLRELLDNFPMRYEFKLPVHCRTFLHRFGKELGRALASFLEICKCIPGGMCKTPKNRAKLKIISKYFYL